MKKTGKTSHHFSAAAAALFAFVFILSASAFAADSADKMKGPAFTDPARRFPMPAAWVNKPIQYEGWAEKADIAVSLEQDVYQTILPLIQKYAKEHNLKIAVKEGTCGIAAGMLSRKTVDMGGFCCPPGKEDRLPGIKYHTLGIVSKAFLVHTLNPVDNVSSQQLIEMFRGKIYRWSELRDSSGKPGAGGTIRTVARLHCQTRPGHWRLLLDDDKFFSPRLVEVGSIPDVLNAVATDRDAVGWEVLSMVEKYKKGDRMKPLRVNGYSPTDYEALASGKYPYYRTYTITTWEGPAVENEKARKLVEYLVKEADSLDPRRFGFASASRLKKAGWKFSGDELVKEPR
jgi:ABC-type phosphate transport system substrate-binding protein